MFHPHFSVRQMSLKWLVNSWSTPSKRRFFKRFFLLFFLMVKHQEGLDTNLNATGHESWMVRRLRILRGRLPQANARLSCCWHVNIYIYIYVYPYFRFYRCFSHAFPSVNRNETATFLRIWPHILAEEVSLESRKHSFRWCFGWCFTSLWDQVSTGRVKPSSIGFRWFCSI